MVTSDNATQRKPRRKLTLADRVAEVDASIAVHEAAIQNLKARRAVIVEEAKAAADALARQVREAGGA